MFAKILKNIPSIGVEDKSSDLVTRNFDDICSRDVVVINATTYPSFNSCFSFSGNLSVDPNFASGADNSLSLNNLESLDGNLFIVGSNVLDSITFTDLESLGNLIMSGNSKSPSVSFECLASANNINVDAIGGFEAPDLESVSGNIIFTNTTFEVLRLPCLTSVQSNFELINPSSLSTLGLSELLNVGNFIIDSSQQSSLSRISIPQLLGVDERLSLTGSFSSISVPCLLNVGQSVNVESGGVNNSLNCTSFLATLGEQLPNTQVTCDNVTANANAIPAFTNSLGVVTATRTKGLVLSTSIITNSQGVPTATIVVPARSTNTNSPPSKDHSLSPGAEAGLGVGVGVLVILLCVLAYFLVSRRRQAKTTPKNASTENSSAIELQGGGPYVRAEAEVETVEGAPAEAELDGVHAVYEVEAGNNNWFPNRKD